MTDGKSIVDDPTSTDDCCPSGLTCKVDGTLHSCQIDSVVTDPNIHVCSDYGNDKTGCLADRFRVGHNGVGTSGCGQVTANICGVQSSGTRPGAGCKCDWNIATGKCFQSGSSVISLFDGNVDVHPTCNSISMTTGDCVDGVMQLSEQNDIQWTAADIASLQSYLTLINDPLKNDPQGWLNNHCDLSSICFSGTKNVLCGENGVKLGFFNIWNLLIAVISIIGIYSVIYFKKK